MGGQAGIFIIRQTADILSIKAYFLRFLWGFESFSWAIIPPLNQTKFMETPHPPQQFAASAKKISVLVVDDVLSIRLLLRQIINQAPDLYVLGMAADPLEATELLKTLSPDVITLDVEMPKMDGLTFLQKLMRLKPTPVVMISTLTAKGSAKAIRALELGAAEVLGKPSQKVADIATYSEQITDAIRAAAATRKNAPVASFAAPTPASVLPEAKPPAEKRPPLIALGASTGGTEALKVLLKPLPPTLPPIFIVQHMPEGFTAAFAKRLNELATLTVLEGQHRMLAQVGCAYIAQGGKHMEVKYIGGSYYIQLTDAPP